MSDMPKLIREHLEKAAVHASKIKANAQPSAEAAAALAGVIANASIALGLVRQLPGGEAVWREWSKQINAKMAERLS